MNNLPDGCSDKEISDAGEAMPAKDAKVVAYIKSLVPQAWAIEIDETRVEGLIVSFCIDRGDVER